MIRKGHNASVNFFTGAEVEHTPAFGLRTLFVVGVQDPQIVLQEFDKEMWLNYKSQALLSIEKLN